MDDLLLNKLKKDVKETELEKLQSGTTEAAEEDSNKNQRRAEEAPCKCVVVVPYRTCDRCDC